MNSSMPDSNPLGGLIIEGEFDPFEDTQPNELDDAYDEVVDFIGAPQAAIAASITAKETDERSKDERIADLFVAMAPRRRVLIGILAFCTESPVYCSGQK